MKYNTETFIERAKEVHGDLYDYSKAVYQRSTEKVEIICPLHGSFFQRPENHVNQKQQCPRCSNERKGKHTRFSFEWMMEHPERAYAPALVYVKEVKNKWGDCLEFGVTTKSIKLSHKSVPSSTLLYLKYMSLKQALLLEGEIEKTMSSHAINPKGFFVEKTKRLSNSPAVLEKLNQLLLQN